MNKKGFPDFVLSTMKNLNMVMILYLTMVTVHSLYGYVDGNSAMDPLPEQEEFFGENGSGAGDCICYQLCAEFQLYGYGASHNCRYHALFF